MNIPTTQHVVIGKRWSPAATRAWHLFSTWCAATGHDSLPCDLSTIDTFLSQVPCSPSTGVYRLSTICRAHKDTGYPLLTTATDRDVTASEEEVDAELAHCAQATAWPAGFHARRDAWLIVLCRHLGWSRRRALDLKAAQVDFSGDTATIAGESIAATDDPATCRRCAVTRWLRIIGEADRWGRNSAKGILHRRIAGHDCHHELPASAGDVAFLSPAIDQWGWVADWQPMSPHHVSRVLAVRRRNAALDLPVTVDTDPADEVPATPRPMQDWSTDSVLDLLEERTEQSDVVLRRIQAILDDDTARFGQTA